MAEAVVVDGGSRAVVGADGAASDDSFLRNDQETFDALSAEVFNLKLAVQAYEERLAVLYQTQDRSRWRGSSTLLVDLEAADQRVDSLEDEVAVLRERLEAVRQAHDSSRERDRGEAEYREMLASGDDQELLDRHLAHISELRAKIAGLEEDNRILALAAGWEAGEMLEQEEEEKMPISREQKRRLTAVEVLRARLLELAARVTEAEEREAAARNAAGETSAGLEKADARVAEYYAAAQHYKRGKLAAEERMEALRVELAEVRRAAREGAVEAVATARDERSQEPNRRPVVEIATQASQTEADGDAPGVSNDQVARLEAELHTWREACARANEQLRQEANHAGVTNRLLAEHDATIQELIGKLLERTAGQGRSEQQQLRPNDQAPSKSEADHDNTSPAESGVSTEEDTTWSGVRASVETRLVSTNTNASIDGPSDVGHPGTNTNASMDGPSDVGHPGPSTNTHSPTNNNGDDDDSNNNNNSNNYGSSTSSSVAFVRSGELGSSADTTNEAVAAAVAAVAAAADAEGSGVGGRETRGLEGRQQRQIRRRDDGRAEGNGGLDLEDEQEQMRGRNEGGRGRESDERLLFEGNDDGSGAHTPTLLDSRAVAMSEAGPRFADGYGGRWHMPSSALDHSSGSSSSSSSRPGRRIRGEALQPSLSQTAAANSSAETVTDGNRVSFDLSEGGTEGRDEGEQAPVTAGVSDTSGVASSGISSAILSHNAADDMLASQGHGQTADASTGSSTVTAPPAEEEYVFVADDAAATSQGSATVQRRQAPTSALTELEGFSATPEGRPSTCGAGDSAKRAAKRAENAADCAERSARRAQRSAEIARFDRIAAQTAAAAAHERAATIAAAHAPKHGSCTIMADPQEGTVSSEWLNEANAARALRRVKQAKRAARLAERAALAARLQQLAAATAAEETGSSYCSSAESYDGTAAEQHGGGEQSPAVQESSEWGTGGGQLPGDWRPARGAGLVENVNPGGSSRERCGAYYGRDGGAGKETGRVEEEKGEADYEAESKSPDEQRPANVQERHAASAAPKEQARTTRRVQWVEETRHTPPSPMAPSPAGLSPADSVGLPGVEHSWNKQENFPTTGTDPASASSSASAGGIIAERPPSRAGRFMPASSQMPPVDEEESESVRSQGSGGEHGRHGAWVEEKQGGEMWAEREGENDSSRGVDSSVEEPWREGRSTINQGWTSAAADNSFSSYVENVSGGSLQRVDLTAGTIDTNQNQPWDYWQRPVVEAASEKSASVGDESFQRNEAAASVEQPREQTDRRSFDETAVYGPRRPAHDLGESSWDAPVPARGRTRQYVYPSGNYNGVVRGARGEDRAKRTSTRHQEVDEFGISSSVRRGRDFDQVERRVGAGDGRTAGGVASATKTKKKKKAAKRSATRCGRACTHPHAEDCARSCACPTCPCGQAPAVSSTALWHARRRSRSTRAR